MNSEPSWETSGLADDHQMMQPMLMMILPNYAASVCSVDHITDFEFCCFSP